LKKQPKPVAGNGLVLGTMYGGLHTITEFDRNAMVAGPKYAKPMDFANTVLNAASGQTALWHKLTGVNATLSCGSASAIAALSYAAERVRLGQAPCLLAGGAEELSFPSLHAFHYARKLSPHAVTRPFDPGSGLILSEGAALVMLEPATTRRNMLAQVLGSASGYLGTRPHDRLTNTIRTALDDAQLDPAQLDFAIAAANGGERDQLEWDALQTCIGRRPIVASKAVHGEALGASGGFQTCLCLAIFRYGVMPAVLSSPGEALENVSDRSPRTALITAIGQAGEVYCLILAHPDFLR